MVLCGPTSYTGLRCPEKIFEKAYDEEHARIKHDMQLLSSLATDVFGPKIKGLFPFMPTSTFRKMQSVYFQHNSSTPISRSSGAMHPMRLLHDMKGWIRAKHTDYGELLLSGMKKRQAREQTEETVLAILESWGYKSEEQDQPAPSE